MAFSLRTVPFLTTFIGLVAGVHLYLYRRFAKDTLARLTQQRAVAVVLGAFAATLLTSRLVVPALPEGASALYAALVWLWMALALNLVSFFLVVDLARLGAWAVQRVRKAPSPKVDEDRRRFVARVVAGSAAAVSTSAVGYGIWRAYQPAVVQELSLRVPRWPKALDGYTLVQVSDIHVAELIERRFMEDMVERCNRLRPDLVAVTGDLVDGSVPRLGHAVAALQGLKARDGTFFITGNHEYYSGDAEWCDALTGMGVQVLRNRRVQLGDAGGAFELAGVDDWSRQGEGGYDLDAALKGANPDLPWVLLAHQPKGFHEAAARGVGLQLSGHTHGGQFFPGTALIPLVWEFAAGHYQRQDAHIVVSRGTGFWGPPVRVGSPPEIIRLSLHA